MKGLEAVCVVCGHRRMFIGCDLENLFDLVWQSQWDADERGWVCPCCASIEAASQGLVGAAIATYSRIRFSDTIGPSRVARSQNQPANQTN